MRVETGDMTVGDIGITIQYTVDVTISGASSNIDFIFLKPSGETIRRDSTTTVAAVATYTTVAGDIDEAGDWYGWLYDEFTDFTFIPIKNKFKVAPKPQDMG